MSKLILGLGYNLNEPVFQLQKAVDSFGKRERRYGGRLTK